MPKLLTYPLLIVWYFAFTISVIIWMTILLPLAFLVDYSVKNSTPSTIWVTPIGIWHSDSSRDTLPLYRSSFPQFVLSKRDSFQIEPGETLQFTFDMDDVNISEIAIENSSQQMWEIPVNHLSAAHNFEVSGLSTLQPASTSVKHVVQQAKAGNNCWVLYPVTGLIILIEVIRQILARKIGNKEKLAVKKLS